MTTEERAEKIIKKATQLLRRGEARGWSEALKMAKEQVDA
jgi:hypothetical protein